MSPRPSARPSCSGWPAPAASPGTWSAWAAAMPATRWSLHRAGVAGAGPHRWGRPFAGCRSVVVPARRGRRDRRGWGDWGLLARLWVAAELLTAGSEELAVSLRAAGAPSVRACEPYEGARERPSPFSAGTVSPLEHGELLVRVRARRLLGRVAEKCWVDGRRPSGRSWSARCCGHGGRRRGPAAGPLASSPATRGAVPSFVVMGLSYTSVVEAPLPEVFAWHGRPGALARLSPPWLPGKVVVEAGSLRDGQAVLAFPAGLRWVAQHRRERYDPPHSFVDEVTSLPFRALGWRHTHLLTEAGEAATRVADEVRTPVPARLLRAIFAYRHRQLADDLASHARGRSWRAAP